MSAERPPKTCVYFVFGCQRYIYCNPHRSTTATRKYEVRARSTAVRVQKSAGLDWATRCVRVGCNRHFSAYRSPSDPTLCLREAPRLEPGDRAELGVFMAGLSPLGAKKDVKKLCVCASSRARQYKQLAGGPPRRNGSQVGTISPNRAPFVSFFFRIIPSTHLFGNSA